MTEFERNLFKKKIHGEVLVSADIHVGGMSTESAAEVNITESGLCERLSQFAYTHGKDLQELFQSDRFIYMSCFVEDVDSFTQLFKDEEILKPVFEHGKGETCNFLLSFPQQEVWKCFRPLLCKRAALPKRGLL